MNIEHPDLLYTIAFSDYLNFTKKYHTAFNLSKKLKPRSRAHRNNLGNKLPYFIFS